MNIPQQVTDALLHADGKALATRSADGVNVIPVSMIKMTGGTIWLFNCFMGKTVENIVNDPRVALTCWKGGEGYQIKATASSVTDGPLFEEARQFVSEVNPKRILKSLLVLEPTEIFDVSPNTERAGKRVE